MAPRPPTPRPGRRAPEAALRRLLSPEGLLLAASFTCLISGCAGKDDGPSDDGAGSEVSGRFTHIDGRVIELVGGGAYYDTSEDNALHVFLTDFPTNCSEVSDGLGFHAATGGTFLAFYPDVPDDPFSAGVYVQDGGVQVNWEISFDFTATIDAETPRTTGSIVLEDDRGEATFALEHCGDVEPF